MNFFPANPGFRLLSFKEDGITVYQEILAWKRDKDGLGYNPVTIFGEWADEGEGEYIQEPSGLVTLTGGMLLTFADETLAHEHWKGMWEESKNEEGEDYGTKKAASTVNGGGADKRDSGGV